MDELEFRIKLKEAIEQERENPKPPMFHEIMVAGADDETAMIVARMLRKNGYYLVNLDDIGWDEIKRFKADLRAGQDVREDAGGFFARCINKLLGVKGHYPDEVETHQMAAKRLLLSIDAS